MMPDLIQMHPGYHEGFWDAQALEPLFDDASPEYAAGWRGYWECRRLCEAPGSMSEERSWLPDLRSEVGGTE